MLDYSSDDFTIIVGSFLEAIRNVVTGEITVANRSTRLNGVSVQKNDHIHIVDGKLVRATKYKNRAVVDLLAKVPNIKDKQVLTVIYGKDLTEDEKTKNMAMVKKLYPYLEVGAIDGGQAVYKYLLAIE
jgi:dihydroxyacetone kinase-like predicted kinase